MHPGKSQSKYIDEFHKLVGDLAAIDITISNEDQALYLLTSLPSSYEVKGDGGEGLYVRGISSQRDMEQGKSSVWYNHKKSQGFVTNEDHVSDFGVDRLVVVSEDRVLDRGFEFVRGFEVSIVCSSRLQEGCDVALETLPTDIEVREKDSLKKKAYNTLILCLGDQVLQEVTKETTAAGIWTKLSSLYMTKSLANRLYLKKKLYTYYMSPGTQLGDHIMETIEWGEYVFV
ncbi:hypothetical protein Tco_1354720 [Tanacetum coccineum]